MSPTLTISRPGTSEIRVEVSGTFNDTEDRRCFEDIKATVIEDAYMDREESVITFKEGEPIKLTWREQQKANEELQDRRLRGL